MKAIVNSQQNTFHDRPRDLETYSSAITLSDMEIFIFPELLYSLLLANIMSPRIWAWRDDPWFKGIEKLNPYRRILRLKQYIIDHYEFNLDLDTWGLTAKDKELSRFRGFVDEDTLRRSNALFGYEGDKYYFDIDIRRHFGLDKYTSDIIPYWKTETVEAMDAFRHQEGYTHGAGECVSLSTLYAAALFIVCRIPLDDIFLLATPLHSQNFVDVKDGIITNNRRIVSRNMWFNGTELTVKAQRAIRNEQITIVAHNTGYVHVAQPEASMDREAYARLKNKLKSFLVTDVNAEIVANFLRQESKLQTCFQIVGECHGKTRYIPAERVYAYEHNSSFRVSDNTREKLLAEIDEDEFYRQPIQDRISMNIFEDFFKSHKIDLSKEEDIARLRAQFKCDNANAHKILENLIAFCRIEPRFPDQESEKQFVPSDAIQCSPDQSREEIIAYLDSIRATHRVADLAFYAYRDMTRTEWTPFLKAAMERNPVCVEATHKWTDTQLMERLGAMVNESIYDGPRLAQPDEVWNYQRGDGIERALMLANILKVRDPEKTIHLDITEEHVVLTAGSVRVDWPSAKQLVATLDL
jgi:hypothetical protein